MLASCLESIQDTADEIVVVDTGSTDRTMDIARKFNVGLSSIPWADDFSAARNEALIRCSGDWILYIDADERLEAIEKSKLRPYLEDASKVAHTVRFHPQKNHTPYRECRLFRNDPRIRYKGVIHETILPDIKKVAEVDGLDIGRIPFTIRHDGYDNAQTAKHLRNLPLLKKEVVSRPAYTYLWWHLGCVHMALNQEGEAEQQWKNGLDIIRQSNKTNPHDSLIYGELIRYYHTKGRRMDSLIEEALQKFPNQYYISWLKALFLKSKERYDQAAGIFKQLVGITPALIVDSISYNIELFGVLSLEPLGDCYFKSGELEKSLECYTACEALQPETVSFKIKRQFIESRLHSSSGMHPGHPTSPPRPPLPPKTRLP